MVKTIIVKCVECNSNVELTPGSVYMPDDYGIGDKITMRCDQLCDIKETQHEIVKVTLTD